MSAIAQAFALYQEAKRTIPAESKQVSDRHPINQHFVASHGRSESA
jgi:hypothetical protein